MGERRRGSPLPVPRPTAAGRPGPTGSAWASPRLLGRRRSLGRSQLDLRGSTWRGHTPGHPPLSSHLGASVSGGQAWGQPGVASTLATFPPGGVGGQLPLRGLPGCREVAGALSHDATAPGQGSPVTSGRRNGVSTAVMNPRLEPTGTRGSVPGEEGRRVSEPRRLPWGLPGPQLDTPGGKGQWGGRDTGGRSPGALGRGGGEGQGSACELGLVNQPPARLTPPAEASPGASQRWHLRPPAPGARGPLSLPSARKAAPGARPWASASAAGSNEASREVSRKSATVM